MVYGWKQCYLSPKQRTGYQITSHLKFKIVLYLLLVNGWWHSVACWFQFCVRIWYKTKIFIAVPTFIDKGKLVNVSFHPTTEIQICLSKYSWLYGCQWVCNTATIVWGYNCLSIWLLEYIIALVYNCLNYYVNQSGSMVCKICKRLKRNQTFNPK